VNSLKRRVRWLKLRKAVFVIPSMGAKQTRGRGKSFQVIDDIVDEVNFRNVPEFFKNIE
jgi:hypothetical protein